MELRDLVLSSACFLIPKKVVTKKTVLSNNSSSTEVFKTLVELLVPCLPRTSSTGSTHLSSGATMAHWRRPLALRRSSGQFWRRCNPLQSAKCNSSTTCGWTIPRSLTLKEWETTDPPSHWIREPSTTGTSPSTRTMSTSSPLSFLLWFWQSLSLRSLFHASANAAVASVRRNPTDQRHLCVV